jgi:Tol biopolymer transport system component
VWSPDGTRILFRNWTLGEDRVEVVDAGGGNRVTLATRPGTDLYCWDRSDHDWSPDGRTVVFSASDACDGRHALYAVPADGSAPPTALLAPDMLTGAHATFSPDGTRLAFVGTQTAGSTGLYVLDVGPTGVLAGSLQARRIGPDLEANVFTNLPVPRWSPDGTELAVATLAQPQDDEGKRAKGEIIVIRADGSGHRSLTAGGAFNPVWSSDGTRVAFQRTVDPSDYFDGRPCTVRTWVVDADGSDERRLDPLGDGCERPPIWSPDGSRLLMTMIVDDAFRLGVITVDGDDPPVILTDASGASWQPVVAPLPPAPSFPAGSPNP